MCVKGPPFPEIPFHFLSNITNIVYTNNKVNIADCTKYISLSIVDIFRFFCFGEPSLSVTCQNQFFADYRSLHLPVGRGEILLCKNTIDY